MSEVQVERWVAVDKNANCIDEMIGGVGRFSRKTVDELALKYGQLDVVTLDEMATRVKERFSTPPKPITKERFWQLLEVLPPSRWRSTGNSESFFVPEALTGTIHTVCVRIGKSYFSMDRCVASESNSDWLAMCAEALH